jgi:hypothetical protein
MFIYVLISAFLSKNTFRTNKEEFKNFGSSATPLDVVPVSYFEFTTSVGDEQCCHKEI